MDLKFSLELADAALRGREFRPLDRGQTRDEAPVDPVLGAPEVDGLIADAEVAGEIGDPST